VVLDKDAIVPLMIDMCALLQDRFAMLWRAFRIMQILAEEPQNRGIEFCAKFHPIKTGHANFNPSGVFRAMWLAAKRRIRTALQIPARFLIARALVPALPLTMRKQIVVKAGSRGFFARSFLVAELLADLARENPAGYHRFLWENHVGGPAHAKTYEISHRFGDENLRTSRRELLQFLRSCLIQRGTDPERDVRSVFDVGCSLGYVLRFVEKEIFPASTCLRGMDVDRYAIDTGNAYLRQSGSKIELVAGDVSELDQVMGKQTYDVVFCCGVLMYLNEDDAARSIEAMLRHTRGLLGLITLADPHVDNAQLNHSYVRSEDLGFVHNVDRMVAEAGGHVVFRKWTDPDEAGRYARNPPLFTLARPGTKQVEP